jgi:hypothetical protein
MDERDTPTTPIMTQNQIWTKHSTHRTNSFMEESYYEELYTTLKGTDYNKIPNQAYYTFPVFTPETKMKSPNLTSTILSPTKHQSSLTPSPLILPSKLNNKHYRAKDQRTKNEDRDYDIRHLNESQYSRQYSITAIPDYLMPNTQDPVLTNPKSLNGRDEDKPADVNATTNDDNDESKDEDKPADVTSTTNDDNDESKDEDKPADDTATTNDDNDESKDEDKPADVTATTNDDDDESKDEDKPAYVTATTNDDNDETKDEDKPADDTATTNAQLFSGHYKAAIL